MRSRMLSRFLLVVLYLCSKCSAEIPNVFFLLHNTTCHSDETLIESVEKSGAVTPEESKLLNENLHSVTELHRRRRLGALANSNDENLDAVFTAQHSHRKLSEMDAEYRRDTLIAALQLVYDSRLQKLIKGGGKNVTSTLYAAIKNESVLQDHLKNLEIDVIKNDLLPKDELFKFSKALPCQRYQPEKNVPRQFDDVHIPNDRFFDIQRFVMDLGNHGVNVLNAWKTFTGSNNGMVVAVVDSGCSMNPDLEPNMCKPGDNCAGYDFADGDVNPHDENLSEVHGTPVSAIIAAATHNKFGMSGICWGCKIMCLKVVPTYSSGFSALPVIKALEFMIKNKVKLSNHSYSGYGFLRSEELGIRKLRDIGHLFIAAAGNDGCDLEKPTCLTEKKKVVVGPTYPASYNLDNVISVGSVDYSGTKMDWSNYGREKVHLAAPGTVFSLTNSKATTTVLKLVSGTSFSAPLVTGAAALLWSRNPKMTYLEVKHALLSTVRKVPELQGVFKYAGHLDIGAALQTVTGPTDRHPLRSKDVPSIDNTEIYYKKNISQKRPPVNNFNIVSPNAFLAIGILIILEMSI